MCRDPERGRQHGLQAVKAARGDTDNLVGPAGDFDELTDHMRVGREARSPELLGQDHYRRRRRVVAFLQRPAKPRRGADCVEVGAGHGLAERNLADVVNHERGTESRARTDGAKHRLLRAQVLDVGPRQRHDRAAPVGDCEEPFRIRNPEGCPEERADGRIDGR